jgi:putative ABC transport system permease protein
MIRAAFGVRLRVLLRFYAWRLRRHGLQELLAGGGLAAGVALVFGVLVANMSLTGSAAQLLHAIYGNARLELAARSADGFDERLAARAAVLPGVAHAAPILRSEVTLVGPKGRRLAHLIGITPDLATLGGRLTSNLGNQGVRLTSGVGLPSELAQAIGVRAGQRLTVLVSGSAHRVVVGTVAGSGTIGGLAQTSIAIAALPVVQQLAGEPGRVSQLIIEPRPGADAALRTRLQALAAGRLDVAPADQELRLLRELARPNDQSTGLFAAIGAMVGFLLALSAMLLTVPERRRFVAELRMQGFEPRQVLLVIGFEALALGLSASVAGLALGDLLARTMFGGAPAYIAFAFPIGSQTIISGSTVALGLGVGLLASLAASLVPALDLLPSRDVDAVFREAGEAGEGAGERPVLLLAAVGAGLLGAVGLAAIADPGLTVVGGGALALATVCLVPATFATVTDAVAGGSRRLRGSMLAVAALELKSTTIRSIAIAGVASVAVYGSVAMVGAHGDLVRGLDRAIADLNGTADIWVTTGGDDPATNSFDPGNAVSAIARAPGVSSVREYHAGLLDVGDRRVWIIAHPSADPVLLPADQVVKGDAARANALIRRGGWAAVSQGFARSRKLVLGGTLALPTPAGLSRLRVAALTTNRGWSPGAITLNAEDYRRDWRTSKPAGLEIRLAPGTSMVDGKRAVESALGARPGLRVETVREHDARYTRLARQGVRTLTQISTLLLLAAGLSVALALSGSIWQRRTRLAALKVQGFDRFQLWRSLLLESAVLVCAGSALGAAVGIYGHALASRWLERSTGFAAPFSISVPQVLVSAALVGSVALAVVALPGFAATRVPAAASFQD